MKNADAAAYPQQVNGGDVFGGFTKRERIAMDMAKGILSNPQMIDNMDPKSIEWVSKRAASMTDALLAELERTK